MTTSFRRHAVRAFECFGILRLTGIIPFDLVSFLLSRHEHKIWETSVGLKVYGLQNCDSCRKAKKWLEAEAISFEFHDLRKSPIDAETLRHWLSSIGAGALINRRGTTWRTLSDSQMTAHGEALVSLIMDHPAIMKRPIFVTEHDISVGFNNKQKQTLAN